MRSTPGRHPVALTPAARRVPGLLALLAAVLLAGWVAPPALAHAGPAPRVLLADDLEFDYGGGASDEGSGLSTGAILGIIGGIVVVVLPVVLYLMQGQKEKKSVAGGSVEKGVIGGYRLKNHLMTGQTSQVWEVVEEASSRHFAMKILLPEKAKVQEHRKFLFHEAEVGLELAHPNIIKIVKVIRDAENPCFIMEFFPSGSLKLRMMRKQTELIKDKAHDILKQAATALAFMNAKGWVHRDVKPDNILVSSAGDVRLIDFALAKRVEHRSALGKLTRRKGPTQGTRSYMSPEQIRNEPLDGRADVYSFGATCYELVTGRPPFRGASSQDLLNKHLVEKPVSPAVHNPDVTQEFAELVLRMLAKKREERPKDFHEVLMALRTLRVFKSDPVRRSG